MKGDFFYQDNIPAHTSLVSMTAVRHCWFDLFDEPPYSSDQVTSIICTQNKKNKHLSGHQYSSDYDVISAVEDVFEQQDESSFINGIQVRQHRWKKSVDHKDINISFPNEIHLVSFDYKILVSLNKHFSIKPSMQTSVHQEISSVYFAQRIFIF